MTIDEIVAQAERKFDREWTVAAFRVAVREACERARKWPHDEPVKKDSKYCTHCGASQVDTHYPSCPDYPVWNSMAALTARVEKIEHVERDNPAFQEVYNPVKPYDTKDRVSLLMERVKKLEDMHQAIPAGTRGGHL